MQGRLLPQPDSGNPAFSMLVGAIIRPCRSIEGGRPMDENLKTSANWAKELGISEKKLKDAIKAAGIAPDAKKGVCAFYSRESVQKVAGSIS